MILFQWKTNGTKTASFYSRTWVKMWQIPQKLLNDQFTNVLTQKLIKTNFLDNYRA